MSGDELSVLLIEENPGNFSGIIRKLEGIGCRFRIAGSYTEARLLVAAETPELVLSVVPPRENAMALLTEALAGTSASVFYAHPVEDGCWWLPALRDGLRCFGAPALRPNEFTNLLDRVIKEIRERRAPARQIPASTPRAPHAEPAKAPKKALAARSAAG